MSCVIVVTLFSLGLYKLSALVERKASCAKYASFYQQKDNFDVLFIGDSHVMNGVFPMELWKRYGIISYNFGGHANRIPLNYWQLINALDYVLPKVVVLDCHTVHEQNKILRSHISNSHLSLDAIPFSVNKIKATGDLFDDWKESFFFLFDLSVYHDRWRDLGKEDFSLLKKVEKGAESRIGLAVPRNIPDLRIHEKSDDNSVGVRYLESAIKFCREKQIEIVLTYLPFPASDKEVRESHLVYDIAKRNNVQYLSWETLKDIVDFDIDCYDPNSHLNPSGARKITKFLGKYIKEYYDIPDHRNDPKFASWYKDYQEYTRFKIDTLKNQKSLKNVLMLLSDRNFSYIVYFPNDRHYQNRIIMKLLRNTGADVEQIYFQSPKLIVVDNRKKKVSYGTINETVGSSFGKLSLKNTKDGHVFDMNGQTVLEIKNGERLEAAVIAFDNKSGKLIVARKYQAL